MDVPKFQMIINELDGKVWLEFKDYKNNYKVKFKSYELKGSAIMNLAEMLIRKTKPLFKQVAEK